MARLMKLRIGGVLLPLVILWVVMALTSDRFLTFININNVLVQFSIIGVLAVGTTFVVIAREIDLSIGSIMGFCAVTAALTAVTLGLPWPVAVLIAIAAGAAFGLFNGAMVTIVGVPSFVVTLGSLGIVNGLALTLTQGQSIYGFPDGYLVIGQGRILGINVSVLFCLALVLILQGVLKGTGTGLNFYAVGGNEKAARLAGISVVRTKLIAFVLSGACAGLAGVMVSSRLNAANPTFGTLDLLDAIAAVVIGGAALSGGVGSIVGAAAGALLIVSIRNGLNLHGVNPFIQQTAIGLMIIVAALLDRLSQRNRA
jgi:ribose/xylose/arabinose/galactoside ABC-type transport system permease subunit